MCSVLPSSSTTIAYIILISVLSSLLSSWYQKTRSLQLPPSPFLRLPLFGNLPVLLWEFLRNDFRITNALVSICEKNGGIALVYIGQFPCILFSSLPDMKAILLKNSQLTSNRPDIGLIAYQKQMSKSLAFQDFNQKYQKVKKIMLSVFSNRQSIQNYETLFEKEIRKFCKEIGTTGEARVLYHDFRQFSFKIILQFTGGGKMLDDKELCKNIFEGCESQLKDVHLIFVPSPKDLCPNLCRYIPERILDIIFTRYRAKVENYHNNCKRAQPYLQKLVKKARAMHSDGSLETNTVLFHLFKNSEKWGDAFEDVDIIRDIIIGGYHATSEFCGVFINTMCRYQDVWKDLQEEVNKLDTFREYISSNDVDKLHLVKAVYYEVHRCTAFVGSGFPHSFAGDVSYNGFLFPANTVFLPLNQAPLWNGEVFESPQEFNPYRWLEADGKFTTDKKMLDSWIPFGIGARMCIGSTYTGILCCLLIANLARNIDFELAEGQSFHGTTTNDPVLKEPTPYRYNVTVQNGQTKQNDTGLQKHKGNNAQTA